MKRAINQLINKELKGVDIYSHNGSMWFIFTKEKRWVFEYTKENVLWYNYSLFNNVFNFVSLDVIENSEYITDWFTKNILDKPLSISGNKYVFEEGVISIIENGVKETEGVIGGNIPIVGRVIEDGVKNIWANEIPNEYNWSEDFDGEVEDIIQNGVLSTLSEYGEVTNSVEDTIQNGVKHTRSNIVDISLFVEDTIQNGVLSTNHFHAHQKSNVEDTIQNGVLSTCDGTCGKTTQVEDTIQNGVLSTRCLEFRASIMVEDTIQNGVKHTGSGYDLELYVVEDTIQNGVKHTTGAEFVTNVVVEKTIQNGVLIESIK